MADPLLAAARADPAPPMTPYSLAKRSAVVINT